jgi:hypothetical protein
MTMSNVKKLPGTFELQWRVYERRLRDSLATYTVATSEEIDYAMSQLRAVYLEHATAPPAVGEEQWRALNQWIGDQLGPILLQFAACQCELFSLRGAQ